MLSSMALLKAALLLRSSTHSVSMLSGDSALENDRNCTAPVVNTVI